MRAPVVAPAALPATQMSFAPLPHIEEYPVATVAPEVRGVLASDHVAPSQCETNPVLLVNALARA